MARPEVDTERRSEPPRRFHVTTLGCPKNVVDSEKVTASLLADGLIAARDPEDADLLVVNTCAFIEAAREESIEVALDLAGARKPGAQLVLTGCMAERYGEELAAALPEADAVVGFAGEGSIVAVLGRKPHGVRDLLELPRPAPQSPWAYVKVAEGCDRACAFCAIPSFRGKQRSRDLDAIVAEARSLVEGGVAELVLVAQDLAWYGRDVGMMAGGGAALAGLLRQLDGLSSEGLRRVRLLYLYPSEVRDPLVSTMLELPGVASYFDLSLQHASAPLLRKMRRWGNGDRFRSMVDRIRTIEPDAAFRSSFIVGFPGETEDDHETLLAFVESMELDWAGFFAYSQEEGTAAASMADTVDPHLVAERLRELGELQDRITAARRDALVGCEIEVLIDGVDPDSGIPVGRTHREAPEIDGVVLISGEPAAIGELARPGNVVRATVRAAIGPDIEAVIGPGAAA